MATSKVEIVNMALGHLGPDMSVVNFETDTSRPARLARTFYHQTLREMLNDFPWPFAAVFQPLTIVEWYFSRERRFAYAYPENCLKVRRLFSVWGENRNDDQLSRQRFKIIETPVLTPATCTDGVWTPGQIAIPQQLVSVILADHPNLQVEFTADDKLVTDFSAPFVAAFAYKLANYMAPALTGGDPYKLGDRAMAGFLDAWGKACSQAGNEEIPDEPSAGEFNDQRQGPWIQRGMYGGYGQETPNYPSGYQVENS